MAHRTRVLTLPHSMYAGLCSCGHKTVRTANREEAATLLNEHEYDEAEKAEKVLAARRQATNKT